MKTNSTKFLTCLGAVFLTVQLAYSQTTHDVTASGMSFNPADITIDLGDTVRWTNAGGTHNVNGTTTTFPSNPESFGNSVGSGWVFDHKFTTAGTYIYRCDVHFGSGMFGAITVVDPTAGLENVAGPDKQAMRIYPVPASSELTIEISESLLSESTNLEVMLFDMSGKEVLRNGNIANASVTISTSQLTNAMYILKLVDGAKTLETRSISINN